MTPDEKGKFVSLAEVKNILRKMEKERKELSYEQHNALDHANKFVTLSIKKTKDMINELKKMEHLEAAHAYRIADLLPKTKDDVKAIFAKERFTPNDNDIKQILDIVYKHSSE